MVNLKERVKKGSNHYRTETGIETRYMNYILANLNKKALFITARVHPGETQASFSLEGMMNYLLSDIPEAKALRSKYIIYVIPMLNIDGVIHGNHRTDLTGSDLNRRWSEPSPYLHPIIYATKNLAKIGREGVVNSRFLVSKARLKAPWCTFLLKQQR